MSRNDDLISDQNVFLLETAKMMHWQWQTYSNSFIIKGKALERKTEMDFKFVLGGHLEVWGSISERAELT